MPGLAHLRGLLLAGLAYLTLVSAVPPGFPSSGNGLWYTRPARLWSREYLPLGNGYLAAMTPGGTLQEATQLNIESLWFGGPFTDPTYNGGNKQPDERASMADAMQALRQAIFSSPDGTIEDVNVLTTDPGAYGSYAGAGYLVSTFTNIPASSTATNYGRYLDLDTGIARTTWAQAGATYTRDTFCSHPARACAQRTSTSTSAPFSHALSLTVAFSAVAGMPTPTVTCLDGATLHVAGAAGTDAAPGMRYELLAHVHVEGGGAVGCAPVATGAGGGNVTAPANATLSIEGTTAAWVVWVGGTEYDIDAGDAAHSFSFRGAPPYTALVSLLSAASAQPYPSLLAAHTADFRAALNPSFALDLSQRADLRTPTDQLAARYATDVGNPYVEWLLFNYGRYLLVSSARGALPANLQGKWARDGAAAWSGDYHANINLQMNYWAAESTGLDVTRSLWDFIEKTWAPRGAYTAEVLYDIQGGWVTHDEMNIFGHTGMKSYVTNPAEWADYPESNAWVAWHIWDHFEYTRDEAWWKAQGYPLLKDIARFHLAKLVPDAHFKDGTLVVAPCNSPEQPPVTFGCAHAQQLIWALLNAAEAGSVSADDTDAAFLADVRAKRAQMDKGVHVGKWGQLQEWKVDMDSQTDMHRHLSHLVGLFPGGAIAGYDPALQASPGANYTREEVLLAARVSLVARGEGTGPDADAGWAKVWRAACWAQLGDAGRFYHQLTYAIARNFGANLLSLYDPANEDAIFQVDANLGYPAAVMNALLSAPPVAATSALTITLLPALPRAWGTGSLRGARVRGGLTLDLFWRGARVTRVRIAVDAGAQSRAVRLVYMGMVEAEFETRPGAVRTLEF